MRQLTSLDTTFLAAEDGRATGHVAGLAVYDTSTAPGGELTLDALRELIDSRLHMLPPFRWRLVTVPFDLDHAYWAVDPDFDLDYHVRELALSAPGDDRQLAEQVARIHSRPLDREHPLWELYLIHGLAEGRTAIYTKVHHAAVDGMSGAELTGLLLDPTPDGREVPAPKPGWDRGEAIPGRRRMFVRGLAGLPNQPVRALRSLPRILPNLDAVPAVGSLPGAHRVAATARALTRNQPRTRDGDMLQVPRSRIAPRTPFNQPLSGHLRTAFGDLSLTEAKAIKNHFGVTVNDVVVAVCAGGLRSYLAERGELPDEPLVAMVPVSVRTPEQRREFGNRVSTILAPVPTDEPVPQRRLTRTHEVLLAAKQRHQAVPASILQDAQHFIPPALFARGARVTAAVAARYAPQLPINFVISNVPGSPVDLYCAGAKLESNFPISAIAHSVGLNITVISHKDRLCFGIVVDREHAGDAWPILDAIRSAQAELLGLLPPKERPRKPRARSRSASV